MIIIKGEIKTREIVSCQYNRNTKKWDVEFNNGKKYSYNYLNVEKLKEPQIVKYCDCHKIDIDLGTSLTNMSVLLDLDTFEPIYIK